MPLPESESVSDGTASPPVYTNKQANLSPLRRDYGKFGDTKHKGNDACMVMELHGTRHEEMEDLIDGVKEEMKVLACPDRRHRLRTNGEGKSKSNCKPRLIWKMAMTMVCVGVVKSFNILTTEYERDRSHLSSILTLSLLYLIMHS